MNYILDNLTAKQRRKNMQHIKNKDTLIELKLRTKLWNKGYRYRKNVNNLPGKPDIVLPKYKIAIFCDSEFFHGKDWDALKSRLEKSNNSEYWIKKISRNRQRDDEINKKLSFMGYYSADCLLHRANCAGPRSQCKIRLDVGVNKTDKIAGYIQENYCENIAEFGDALIGMRIGEPYLLLNAIKILNNINIVNVLRQWDMAIEYEVDDRRPSITCRDIILVNVRQYYETKNDRKIRSIKERLEKEGELLEMKKPEEEFIDAMRYLFGEEFVKNEKFTEKYKKVLKRDDELKAHYGDCDSVKQLMLYIRKNMRKYGYAPNYKLPEIFENNELDYNKYREAVIEGMRNSKFEKLFPETYTYEFKRNKLEYDTDGWNYNKMDYQEEDWICKKRGSYHCYYNQLDHYLSHLLSVIRKNSEMGNCQGIEPVRMELKQKIDSYCMAKKER